ncbi:MAG: DUF520 family protein [Chlorobiaceae bacterium]|nr:DUF520 family protein [Chlorobiaceae bacterium]
MPSFDIISEFDTHEVKNAVDQANKEVSTRFDFKGSNSTFELTDDKLVMISESTFQLQQMFSVVCSKLSRRGVDVACMDVGDAKGSGKMMLQKPLLVCCSISCNRRKHCPHLIRNLLTSLVKQLRFPIPLKSLT